MNAAKEVESLDQIVADTDTIMTPVLRRLFLSEDCDPCCHACGKTLKDGETFQLASYKGTDEMVHPTCGIAGLKRRDKRNQKRNAERREHNLRLGGSGYSRPSKGT